MTSPWPKVDAAAEADRSARAAALVREALDSATPEQLASLNGKGEELIERLLRFEKTFREISKMPNPYS